MNKDVIIALDFDSKEKVFSFLDKFVDCKPFVKIGMELTMPKDLKSLKKSKSAVTKSF